MAVLSNTMLQGTAAISDDTDYQIEKSLRFNVGDQPRLTRTNDIAGNRCSSTCSFWCKPGLMSGSQAYHIYGHNSANDTNTMILYFYGGTSPVFKVSGWNTIWKVPSNVFRDSSAWYHIVVTIDTANADAADRIRVYINGKRVTDFSTSNNPNQFVSLGWGIAGNYGIGVRPDDYTQGWFEGYLADLHYIDGLSLSPAAWGAFNSKGVWTPSTFSLPAPNDESTWSNGWSGTFTSGNEATKSFDGLLSTGSKPSNNYSITWTGDIPVKQGVRIYWECDDHSSAKYADILVNGIPIVPTAYNAHWELADVVDWGSNNLTSIKTTQANNKATTIKAIEVDGVILRDGYLDTETFKNANNGTEWSESRTGDNSWNNGDTTPSRVFDGTMDGSAGNPVEAASDNNFTFTFGGGISNVDTLDIDLKVTGSIGTDTDCKVNGTSIFNAAKTAVGDNVKGWYRVPAATHGGNLNSLYGGRDSGGNVKFYAIKVNGVELIDKTQDTSFHLNFNDVSNNERLGKDILNGKLADANGALPILNTTDDQGLVLGSGNATDSDNSDLVLAIPGNTLTDVSDSPHTLTNDSIVVKTDASQFYGSSLYFNDAGDLSAPYSADFLNGYNGNFTIELWIKQTGQQGSCSLMSVWDYGNNKKCWNLYIAGNNKVVLIASTDGSSNSADLAMSNAYSTASQWCHLAMVRNGNTVKHYQNGIEQGSSSFTGTLFNTTDAKLYIGSTNGQTEFYDGYMQDIRIYKKAKYTSNFRPPKRNDFIPTNITTSTSDDGATSLGHTRADSNSSNIVLAAPLNGTTNDYSATIKGSGNNITPNVSGTAAETSNTQFYGSTLKFTNDRVTYSANDFNVGTGAFTLEFWVRPQDMAGQRGILQQTDNNGWNGTYAGGLWAYFHPSGTLTLKMGDGKGYAFTGLTAGKWYHVALTRDGSAIAKWFLNGELKSTQSNANAADDSMTREKLSLGGYYSDSYRSNDVCLTDVRFYNGVAKYTAAFTLPHSDTSVTQYAAMGSATGALPIFATVDPVWDKDTSTDTPSNGGSYTGAGGEITGNFCTLNPIGMETASIASLTQGNLEFYAGASGNDHKTAWGSFGVKSGKWYWERTTVVKGGSGDADWPGVMKGFLKNADPFWTGGLVNTWGLKTDGAGCKKANNNSQTANYFADAALAKAGDVIGCALDMDNGKIWWSRNGVWGDNDTGTAGNPAAGTGEAFSNLLTVLPGEFVHPMEYAYSAEGKSLYNFGASPFKYTPPSGFKSLCSQNLSTTIVPQNYFDVKTWTGDSTERDIKGYEFSPDFVWIKNRNDSNDHALCSQIQGSGNILSSAEAYYPSQFTNGSDPESAWGSVKTFNSDGFTLQDGPSGYNKVNLSAKTYVGWAWDAGSSAATASTDGSITPSAQWINATAGFSITKWNGTEAAATVGHGLGAPPEFIMVKSLEEALSWAVYHKDVGNTHAQALDTDAVPQDADSFWNDTTPTNTVFSVKNASRTNGPSKDMIAYAWTPIEGYSAFGSFTGNGSADGPFVYTGFQPRWIMTKNTETARQWVIWDTKRSPYNFADECLFPDVSNAEAAKGPDSGTDNDIDILSNGFKIRNVDSAQNESTKKIIYAAFAEHPLKTTRAR